MDTTNGNNDLSLRAITRTTGINPHTLRAWERRYGAIQPKRTASGRRTYSLADLKRVQLLFELVNKGHAIGRLANNSNAELQNLLKESSSKSPLVATQDPTYLKLESFLPHIIQSLEDFELQEIAQELSWARAAFSAETFALRIIAPMMHEVGQLVTAGHLSIAQEHALSSIVRDQISQVFASLNHFMNVHGEHHRTTVVLATPEGDLHEFGILLGRILCACYEVPTYYLGANIPAKPLAEATQELGANIVLLGHLPSYDQRESKIFRNYVETLDHELGAYPCSLWIGGDHLPETQLSRQVEWLASLEKLTVLLRDIRN